MKNFLESTFVVLPAALLAYAFGFISQNLILTTAALSFCMGKTQEAVLLVVLAFYLAIKEVIEAVDEQTDLIKEVFKVKEEKWHE